MKVRQHGNKLENFNKISLRLIYHGKISGNPHESFWIWIYHGNKYRNHYENPLKCPNKCVD